MGLIPITYKGINHGLINVWALISQHSDHAGCRLGDGMTCTLRPGFLHKQSDVFIRDGDLSGRVLSFGQNMVWEKVLTREVLTR